MIKYFPWPNEEVIGLRRLAEGRFTGPTKMALPSIVESHVDGDLTELHILDAAALATFITQRNILPMLAGNLRQLVGDKKVGKDRVQRKIAKGQVTDEKSHMRVTMYLASSLYIISRF